MANYKSAGLRPAGADREITATCEFDNVVIQAKSASDTTNVLKRVKLFQKPEKHDILQSNAFPLPNGRQVTLTHLAINHTVRFTTEKQLYIFEQFSQLKINIEDRDYPALKIADFLPYNRIMNSRMGVSVAASDGAETTAEFDNLTAFPKMGTYMKLNQPIVVPHNGKISFEFIPGGEDLKTAKIDDHGVKFGAGVIDSADSAAMTIEFKFLGILDRTA